MEFAGTDSDTPGRGGTFTQEIPCPYFSDGRFAAAEFVLPGDEGPSLFHAFLSQGYRRLGRLFYRNVCRTCAACRPLRLDTGTFRLSRSQARTLRRNRDLRVEVGPSEVTAEKLHLYCRYLAAKHGDGTTPGQSDHELALAMIHYGYPRTLEIDYFLGETLVGVGVVDIGAGAMSSNYFYYDTSFPGRRLGVFSVLEEVNLCRLLGTRYYYLGFCIEETNAMSYKRFFRPNQVLRQGIWMDYLKD